MAIDKTFARDIRKIANGNGGEEHRREFRRILREVKRELSTTSVRTEYPQAVKKHGRVPVAICTAVTIIRRADRMEQETIRWAHAVMAEWENRSSDTDFATINDGLHPTRIEEYAGSLIRATTIG